jgi:release factor glutamine methyltransferase
MASASPSPKNASDLADVAARLRAAGSVFAEDEAAILLEAATDDAELDALVTRRISGEPIEPLVGWVRFGRLRLEVGPGVFIPRRRSLVLARAAVRIARTQADPVVLEPFCGVAPIAASVAAAVPAAEIHVSDVDPVPLRFARRNLPAEANVHRGAGLSALPAALRGRVSLVASVPPYVPDGERRFLPREALEHEPPGALFAGADGLDHVRALVADLAGCLRPDGRVLIELHRAQWSAAAEHARGCGWRPARRNGADGQTTLLVLAPEG